jgi:hypothetical protein
MGCCTAKPNKEEMLKHYWANLPIRSVTLDRFTQDLISKYRSFDMDKDIDSFNDFFLNPTYLIFGDDTLKEACTKLFAKLAKENDISWLIFCLAFLCRFDKDNSKNKSNLIILSKFLNNHIVRDTDRTCDEEYILIFHFKKFYTMFVAMVSIESVDPMFMLHNDEEYAEYLKKIYAYPLIDQLVEERIDILGKKVQLKLSSLLLNEFWYLRDDCGLRSKLISLYDTFSVLPAKSSKKVNHSVDVSFSKSVDKYEEKKESSRTVQVVESKHVGLVEQQTTVVVEERSVIVEETSPATNKKSVIVKKKEEPVDDGWEDDSRPDMEQFGSVL